MLEARGLECVRGHRRLFGDLSFSVRPGDCVEVRGANGSGKTSLLRMLCGLLPPASGMILWQGEPIDRRREAFHSTLRYVGHRRGVKDELTAMENLCVSSALHGFELGRHEAQVILARVGLGDQGHVYARHLSEGQRRRLALSRLLTGRSSLWLLDEALTALDATSVATITAIIDEHVAGGGMAVIATHQAFRLKAQTSRRIELAA
jgi:heme exporter protein A